MLPTEVGHTRKPTILTMSLLSTLPGVQLGGLVFTGSAYDLGHGGGEPLPFQIPVTFLVGQRWWSWGTRPDVDDPAQRSYTGSRPMFAPPHHSTPQADHASTARCRTQTTHTTVLVMRLHHNQARTRPSRSNIERQPGVVPRRHSLLGLTTIASSSMTSWAAQAMPPAQSSGGTWVSGIPLSGYHHRWRTSRHGPGGPWRRNWLSIRPGTPEGPAGRTLRHARAWAKCVAQKACSTSANMCTPRGSGVCFLGMP